FVGFSAIQLHTVIADQRISKDQDLPGIGRVGQRFHVTGHAGIEDYFADIRAGLPGRHCTCKLCAIAKAQISSFGFKKIAPGWSDCRFFQAVCDRWRTPHTPIESTRRTSFMQVTAGVAADQVDSLEGLFVGRRRKGRWWMVWHGSS